MIGFQAPETAGETLYFKTIQTCIEGETAWIEEWTARVRSPSTRRRRYSSWRPRATATAAAPRRRRPTKRRPEVATEQAVVDLRRRRRLVDGLAIAGLVAGAARPRRRWRRPRPRPQDCLSCAQVAPGSSPSPPSPSSWGRRRPAPTRREPTDYRSVIDSIEPEVDGVSVEIIGGDAFLQLTVEPGTPSWSRATQGEPYLQILPDGTVQENLQLPGDVPEPVDRYGREDEVDMPADLQGDDSRASSPSGGPSTTTASTPGTTTGSTGCPPTAGPESSPGRRRCRPRTSA